MSQEKERGVISGIYLGGFNNWEEYCILVI